MAPTSQISVVPAFTLFPLRLTLEQSRPLDPRSHPSVRAYRPDLDRAWLHSAGFETTLEAGCAYARGPFRAQLAWRGAWGEHLPARGRLEEATIAWRTSHFAARVGRASIRWAPAAEADLLVSANARPLDHVRFSARSDRLRRLGGLLTGVFDAESFLACLDDPHREVPNPLLWGMRAGWTPNAWLRIEAQRTIMLGGAGRGERFTPRDVWDIFWGRGEGSAADATGPEHFSHRESDSKFAWQTTLHPPEQGPWRLGLYDLEIFGVYAGEDRLSGLMPLAPGRAWGVRAHPTRSLAASFVYASTAVRENIWYHHKVYTDGYTYRGVPLGHPMGADAKTWQLGLFAQLSEGTLASLRIAREKRGIYAIARGIEPGGHWRWAVTLCAPGPRLGRAADVADGTPTTRITATLGGATAWGSELISGRLAEGFARLAIEWVPGGQPLAIDRALVWGDGGE
jgi:hypothetical protein